jgi:uncharacterized protein YgbK (DUF1537 family)
VVSGPPPPPAAPPLDGIGGPVLVLVGSRSSVAREQARLLASEADVERVELDPRELLGGEGTGSASHSQGEGRGEGGTTLSQALATGRDILAVLGDAPLGLERGPALAAALGRLVAAHAARVGGAVATGGDIARAFLNAVGANGLHLLGEVEPGVPLGVADTARPLPVVTKAGAFGSPSTLVRCRAALKDLGRHGTAPSSPGGR